MKLENRGPFYFTEDGIKKIEEMRDATYMGYWCGRTKDGGWAERPLDVFYQAEPDVEAGHTHYFGLLLADNRILITSADSCFSEPMSGILENDTVYVSRYRHDMVSTPGGKIIDGGRDYLRTSEAESSLVTVEVEHGEFKFSVGEVDDKEER